MRPRDIILDQIHYQETHPIPFTLGFEGDVGQRLDQHYDGTHWREWIPRYIRGVSVVDYDRKVALDDTHYQDAFGCIWTTEGRPYHLVQAGMASPSFDGYDFPSFEALTDADLVSKAVEGCDSNRDSFLFANLELAMFERSWYLRGFENTCMDMLSEPDFHDELLDRLTDLHLRGIEASRSLPVDAMLFWDDWCDQRGVIMGVDAWRRLFKPRFARLFEAVHDAGMLTMLHCCGNIGPIIGELIEIGLDVLESVQPEAMDPYELKQRWGSEITFWGALGSQSTVPFGDRQAIFAAVERLCREMACGGGYILAPAKPLQPETSTENAAAVLEAFLTATGHRAQAVSPPRRTLSGESHGLCLVDGPLKAWARGVQRLSRAPKCPRSGIAGARHPHGDSADASECLDRASREDDPWEQSDPKTD